MTFGVRRWSEALRAARGRRRKAPGRGGAGTERSAVRTGRELQLLLSVEGPLRAYLLKGETGEQGRAGRLHHRLLRGTSSLKCVTIVTVVKNGTKFQNEEKIAVQGAL